MSEENNEAPYTAEPWRLGSGATEATQERCPTCGGELQLAGVGFVCPPCLAKSGGTVVSFIPGNVPEPFSREQQEAVRQMGERLHSMAVRQGSGAAHSFDGGRTWVPDADVQQRQAARLPETAEEAELRLWEHLTGIGYLVAPGSSFIVITCRRCSPTMENYAASAKDDDSAESLRSRCEEGFAQVAAEYPCPHWGRFLALRENAEVTKAIRALAKALSEV